MKKPMKKVMLSIAIVLAVYGGVLSWLDLRGDFLDMIVLLMFLGVLCFTILLILWLPELRVHWNSKEYKKKMATLKPSLLTRICMWKVLWMKCIYQYVCLSYLKKKPHHTQAMMEDVLFLMQYESIKKHYVPMLYYKIHIVKEQIYVSFLSDLMSVKDLKDVCVYYRRLPDYSKFMPLYKNMLRKYQKLTQEELRERVLDILEKETLDTDFFCMKECQSDKYLRKARKVTFEEEHPVKDSLHMILTGMTWMYVCAYVFLVFGCILLHDNRVFLLLKAFPLVVIFAYIIYVYDAYKFRKPTEFEEFEKTNE